MIGCGETIGGKQQTGVGFPRERSHRGVNLRGTTDTQCNDLNCQPLRCCLRRTEKLLGKGGRRIEHDRYACCAWHNLPEKLEPLPRNGCLQIRETGGVATGMREACHEAALNWLANSYEHDRHCARRLL